MNPLRELLSDRIAEAVQAGLPLDGEVPLDVPEQESFGDFSTNIALVLAKEAGKAPRELAAELAGSIETGEEIERVEVAGPGFINFYLQPAWVASLLPQVLDEGFGRDQAFQKEKINVEFISANPTGPLTLGNARGGFVGDVLVRTLRFLGHEAQSEYYFNDAGTQMEKLLQSVKIAAGQSEGEPEYRGEYVAELAREFGPELASEDHDELVRRIAKTIADRHIRPAVERMGITFDTWFNEKTLITSGATERAFDRLKELGLLEEREGATWLLTTKLGDERDRVLRKSNGDVTYLGNDIAYHLNILEERGFDRAIKIWGSDHAGQIPSLRLTMKKLLPEKQLNFYVVQWVRLIKGGQEFTMSKRAGTYVTVEDLLDEIGGERSATADRRLATADLRPEEVARWFFISRSHDTHMEFDLDLARERSEKNPVFYVQYAYARIAGILRQAPSPTAVDEIGESLRKDPRVKPEDDERGEPDWSLLVEPEETELIKKLLEFPEVVLQAGSWPLYQTHRLAFYAQELAGSFHKFYHEQRVLEAAGPLREARLGLVRATELTLRKLLTELIGVRAPEKM